MEFTDELVKPSELIPIPSELVRPAFGTLYGFDAINIIDGALLTELSEPLVTELGDVLLFEPT
ncbi:MAG: hypothetical protein GOVbin4318_43 [Prokaryotic dsDNA virus sp.]|nr:MAG: hypothetical protein GOVbin4318_43 [Prokaryotic dsDNA virus sp.]|tara:strand:+ start:37491 stop:37679 length:189 start_codon:yes stop_codon:yes gene_type:complete